jgi:hypothetical protein
MLLRETCSTSRLVLAYWHTQPSAARYRPIPLLDLYIWYILLLIRKVREHPQASV